MGKKLRIYGAVQVQSIIFLYEYDESFAIYTVLFA